MVLSDDAAVEDAGSAVFCFFRFGRDSATTENMNAITSIVEADGGLRHLSRACKLLFKYNANIIK
jgi:hypothetical protein